jgi:hypothetical protein
MRLTDVSSITYRTIPVFKTMWGNVPIPKKSVSPPPPPPVMINHFDINSIKYQIQRKNLDSVDANYMYNSIDSTRTFKIDSTRISVPVISNERYKEIFEYKDMEGIVESYNKIKKIYGTSCVISVSTPIFNSNCTKAILFLNYICGPKEGQGYEFILENKNGKWKLIDELGIWES